MKSLSGRSFVRKKYVSSDRSARRIFGGTIWRKNTRVDAPPTPGQRTKNVNTITRGDQTARIHDFPPRITNLLPLFTVLSYYCYVTCEFILHAMKPSPDPIEKIAKCGMTPFFAYISWLHGCTIIDKHYNCICTLRYV